MSKWFSACDSRSRAETGKIRHRHVRWLPVVLLACTGLFAAGCAGTKSRPVSPNLSALAPAEQAIAEAQSVHADELAPSALRDAQRRLGQARTILLQASLRGTQPDAGEKLAVDRLVEQARVDALLAQALTQRAAVGNALGEFEKALRTEDASDESDAPGANGPLKLR